MKEAPSGLCHKCQHSTIVTLKSGSTIYYCSDFSVRLSSPAVECSSFQEEGKSKWEMERIAWILEVKKGKVVGFVAPNPKKRGTLE